MRASFREGALRVREGASALTDWTASRVRGDTALHFERVTERYERRHMRSCGMCDLIKVRPGAQAILRVIVELPVQLRKLVDGELYHVAKLLKNLQYHN